MIHTPTKRYQLALWLSEERDDASLSRREEFDSLAEAQRALAAARAQSTYRSGILYEWRKDSSSWQLIELL